MTTAVLDREVRSAVVRGLGRWYDKVARELPWRQTRDPYAIWVSEIMLQQTRVDTVIPYFERFMRKYPTVETLARAPLQEVLQQWSGLGYYRRARQLKLAASEVVERYGGEIPRSAAELRDLSGIGRYTAGAVASIAFDESEPIVDGNVIRVLSRLFARPENMRSTVGQRWIWQLAAELVPKKRPGRFNQALMELGARVCLPRKPDCPACPLRRHCQALAKGSPEAFPVMPPPRKPTAMRLVAAVVQRRGQDRFLLACRRVDEGLFGGLWEPPMALAPASGSPTAPLRRLGVSSRRLRPVGQVKHLLTHRKMDVSVFAATAAREWDTPTELPEPYARIAWQAPEEVALSSLARKLLRLGSGG